MTLDEFFDGFFAALAKRKWQFIDTRQGDHHRRFDRVVETVSENEDVFDDLPVVFVPSPITGKYRELEDALVRFQFGILSAQNPFFAGMNVDQSDSRADIILERFSPREREAFQSLAETFVSKSIPTAA